MSALGYIGYDVAMDEPINPFFYAVHFSDELPLRATRLAVGVVLLGGSRFNFVIMFGKKILPLLGGFFRVIQVKKFPQGDAEAEFNDGMRR
ncbi:MAG: hypothetical protein FWC16_05990 [Defluviitaleaceae bacterium]|nr:hypothetical protein [Defluviitaleaceae bacterium]MCL2274459.1 hypothetical protein [Defluviitaleaceae bacterium]